MEEKVSEGEKADRVEQNAARRKRTAHAKIVIGGIVASYLNDTGRDGDDTVARETLIRLIIAGCKQRERSVVWELFPGLPDPAKRGAGDRGGKGEGNGQN